MSFFAIILIVLSALFHAVWNFVSKKTKPSAAFFFVATLLSTIFLIPIPFYFRKQLVSIPQSIWLLALLTGFFQAFYYICLAGAYKYGHMSIAYPMARSSPLLVVTFMSLVLGKADEISWLCFVGVVIIVSGCLILPMKRFGDIKISNYLNKTAILAVAAAVGTAGYSMIDDHILSVLRSPAEMAMSAGKSALMFIFIERIMVMIVMGLYISVNKYERQLTGIVFREMKFKALFTGVSVFIAYVLILISMAFVQNVSYVVAFRQLSIPVGSLLGIFLLKEPKYLPRLIGITVIFAGLILVGLG